jgi:cell wall-associated NlpC family hydrolase
VEKAPMKAYKAGEILNAEQAVSKIAGMNEEAQETAFAKAPLTVALNKVVEEDKAVMYKTKIIKTDELVRGEKEVRVEGEYGNKHVVSDVTMENGEYAGSKVLDSEVTDKAVTKIVYEGTKLTTKDKGELLVQYATRFLGTKYVLGGGDMREGIDCSHFTAALYGKLGISLIAYSYDQEKAGVEVKYEDAQPGDLILYPGHVGLYMGNNMMIHATPDEVKITDDCRYREITCVRRIFTDDDNVTQEMFDELFKEEYNEGAKEIADEKLAKLDYFTMKNKTGTDSAADSNSAGSSEE